ncbi:PQQ-dependent sugar dehydrogenase [Salinactinospora qingdaonensis]|uniref:PQQ-dependent sugar dehydrogenase n=1 Tax=Salinactinospora qingdaonensis TaxID=702744 RepID=A0ABP7FSR4_9ACTN
MLVSACSGAPEQADPTTEPGRPTTPSAPTGDTAETAAPAVADVATGLEVPWGVAFLPSGEALVSERDSTRVVRVAPGGAVEEVGTIEAAEPGGEGGLLGIAVSPDFARDSLLYAYLTADSGNRIVRMSYAPATGLGEPEVIVDGIPASSIHNGGRIAFGPDGMLYAATGDAGSGARSQDTDSLAGKILRMTPEGEPAAGNPFDNLVYSYGHRNVQGLAWSQDGTMFATEFGQNTYDEVNLIEPGNNYGWPEVEGMGRRQEYVDPLLTWRPAEASPSGAAITAEALWVASLRGERLWRIPLTGRADAVLGTPEALFVGDYGRLRAVAAVPGQDTLWVSTSNRDGRGSPAQGDDRLLSVAPTG